MNQKKINEYPDTCNICGNHSVILTSNKLIYGREYGSGQCYYCTQCKSYVGTHKPEPNRALGLLATKEMRDMKMKCHELFDQTWQNYPSRKEQQQKRRYGYQKLAHDLGIEEKVCHFGWFDLEMLQKAYAVIVTWPEINKEFKLCNERMKYKK